MSKGVNAEENVSQNLSFEEPLSYHQGRLEGRCRLTHLKAGSLGEDLTGEILDLQSPICVIIFF